MAYNLAMDILKRRYNPILTTNADVEKNAAYDNLMILVSDVILQAGIPVHIKGYIYLREAVSVRLKEPRTDMPVTKILYPGIAKKFNTSAVGVERAIRHAIDVAWSQNEQLDQNTFIYQLFRFKRKPTNAEFIAMMVEYITLTRN